MSLNVRGMVLGLIVGLASAVGLFVGIQYAVWGSQAPDWYLLPNILGSGVIGMTAVRLGGRYL